MAIRRDALELLKEARGGSRTALAKTISLVERGGDGARSVARAIGELVSGEIPAESAIPYLIGITGAPGAGKSTLTDRLINRYRSHGREIAILAVDPSSPYTGGAILGDRIRMGDHATDPGVYIRSMATRGHLGGLAEAVPQAASVLGVAGFDEVLIETVGVGQVEVEIAGAADTTVVVVNPGWGDSIQANKAGLMEIADLFVINKADRDGVRETRRDIESMLDLSKQGGPRPQVLEAVATTDRGMDEIYSAIQEHKRSLFESGKISAIREERFRAELRRYLVDMVRREVEELMPDEFGAEVAKHDPGLFAEELFAKYKKAIRS